MKPNAQAFRASQPDTQACRLSDHRASNWKEHEAPAIRSADALRGILGLMTLALGLPRPSGTLQVPMKFFSLPVRAWLSSADGRWCCEGATCANFVHHLSMATIACTSHHLLLAKHALQSLSSHQHMPDCLLLQAASFLTISHKRKPPFSMPIQQRGTQYSKAHV